MAFLERNANSGSVSTGFNIGNSLKLESDNSEYLKAEGRPAGNQQTWTWSCWLKRTEVNNGVVAQYMFSAGSDGKLGLYFRDDSSSTGGDTIFIYVDEGNSLKWIGELRVSFRDTSAWYHIVFAVDSTDGTAADRTKIYVNGVQQTITFNDTLNQNSNTRIGDSGGKLSIGAKMDGSYEFNGYMAEVVLVDGSQLTPTSFGEFDDDSGIWKPKDVSSLSLGNAGFYMNFDDSSNLGKVQTGTNQGNFDLNNITSVDQATDTPTNNFCIFAGEQQAVPNGYTAPSVKEGGTTMFGGNVSGAYSTMGIRSGKWYFESTLLHSGGVGTENHGFGVIAANRLYDMNIAQEDIGADVGGWACAGNANPRNNNAGASGANYLTSPAINKVLGCAIDMDNGKIWWHNEGTWHSLNNTVGNPATGASPAWSNLLTATDDFVLPAGGLYQTGSAIRVMNFGGYALPVFTAVGTYSDANGYGSFSYAPPSGYYAICTKNLAEFG